MSRPVGRVLARQDPNSGRSILWLDVRPHIAIRVKRLFPRAVQHHTGPIRLDATDDVCRDVEWLLDRYPMDVSDDARKVLRAGAERDRERAATVERILAGHIPPTSWREPIRRPRDYQLAADALIAQTGSLLLLDVVGLGKTFTSLLRLRDPSALPAVVVTLTNLPEQWLGELLISLPWLLGHVVTSGRPYDPTRRRGVPREPDVLFLNYAKLAGWADYLGGGRTRTVIFDEVQELRRRGTSADPTRKWEAARYVANDARYRYGLSATPIYNYGGEIHNLYEVIAPGALGSREEFVREWGAGKHGGGSDGAVAVDDPRALGTYLREQGLMLRRTRKEVGRELPDTINVVHEVPSDPEKLDELLRAGDVDVFARTLLDAEAQREDRFVAAGEFDMRLRQATGIAKAPYVAQFVRLLLDSEEKVVVYAWHRAVYDILLEGLAEFRPEMYTGSESPSRKRRSKERFLTDPACRVLLMSLRSGAGLDGLQEASHVAVFAELDWSPGVHTQCAGRLARDGMGDEPVVAYYVVTDDGSDPTILDTLGVKRRQSDQMTDPDAEVGIVATADPDRVKRMARAYLERRA